MGYHNNIYFISHNCARPLRVGPNDVVTEESIFDVREIHGAENSRLKFIRLWIIQILQILNRLLLLVLQI